MSKFLYVVGATIIIVGFQNCAKTNFSSQGSTYLAALGDDAPGSGTVDTTDPKTPPTTGDVPPKTPGKDPNKEDDHTCKEHDDAGTDSDFYLCVLEEGRGKSLKLGLVEEALDGVNAVSSVVCVSKAECLGDVAQHFKVPTSAYQRGYCEHNPNVQRLTDAEVKKLLGVQ